MGFTSSSSNSSVKQNSGVNIGATSGNGKVILFPNAITTGANSASSSSTSQGGSLGFKLGLGGLMNLEGFQSLVCKDNSMAPMCH